MDAGDDTVHVSRETGAIFNAQYNPSVNLWLKEFFSDSKSRTGELEFLKHYASPTKHRDLSPNQKVAPAQSPSLLSGATSAASAVRI